MDIKIGFLLQANIKTEKRNRLQLGNCYEQP